MRVNIKTPIGQWVGIFFILSILFSIRTPPVRLRKRTRPRLFLVPVHPGSTRVIITRSLSALSRIMLEVLDTSIILNTVRTVQYLYEVDKSGEGDKKIAPGQSQRSPLLAKARTLDASHVAGTRAALSPPGTAGAAVCPREGGGEGEEKTKYEKQSTSSQTDIIAHFIYLVPPFPADRVEGKKCHRCPRKVRWGRRRASASGGERRRARPHRIIGTRLWWW